MTVINYFELRWVDGYGAVSDAPTHLALAIEAAAARVSSSPERITLAIEDAEQVGGGMLWIGLLRLNAFVSSDPRELRFLHAVVLPPGHRLNLARWRTLVERCYGEHPEQCIRALYEELAVVTKDSGRDRLKTFAIRLDDVIDVLGEPDDDCDERDAFGADEKLAERAPASPNAALPSAQPRKSASMSIPTRPSSSSIPVAANANRAPSEGVGTGRSKRAPSEGPGNRVKRPASEGAGSPLKRPSSEVPVPVDRRRGRASSPVLMARDDVPDDAAPSPIVMASGSSVGTMAGLSVGSGPMASLSASASSILKGGFATGSPPSGGVVRIVPTAEPPRAPRRRLLAEIIAVLALAVCGVIIWRWSVSRQASPSGDALRSQLSKMQDDVASAIAARDAARRAAEDAEAKLKQAQITANRERDEANAELTRRLNQAEHDRLRDVGGVTKELNELRDRFASANREREKERDAAVAARQAVETARDTLARTNTKLATDAQSRDEALHDVCLALKAARISHKACKRP